MSHGSSDIAIWVAEPDSILFHVTGLSDMSDSNGVPVGLMQEQARIVDAAMNAAMVKTHIIINDPAGVFLRIDQEVGRSILSQFDSDRIDPVRARTLLATALRSAVPVRFVPGCTIVAVGVLRALAANAEYYERTGVRVVAVIQDVDPVTLSGSGEAHASALAQTLPATLLVVRSDETRREIGRLKTRSMRTKVVDFRSASGCGRTVTTLVHDVIAIERASLDHGSTALVEGRLYCPCVVPNVYTDMEDNRHVTEMDGMWLCNISEAVTFSTTTAASEIIVYLAIHARDQGIGSNLAIEVDGQDELGTGTTILLPGLNLIRFLMRSNEDGECSFSIASKVNSPRPVRDLRILKLASIGYSRPTNIAARSGLREQMLLG